MVATEQQEKKREDFERIRHALKKFNVIVIAKSPTNLENLVHRKIYPIDK